MKAVQISQGLGESRSALVNVLAGPRQAGNVQTSNSHSSTVGVEL